MKDIQVLAWTPKLLKQKQRVKKSKFYLLFFHCLTEMLLDKADFPLVFSI